MQSVMFYGLTCGRVLLFWPWASGKSGLDTFPVNKEGVSRAEILFFFFF